MPAFEGPSFHPPAICNSVLNGYLMDFCPLILDNFFNSNNFYGNLYNNILLCSLFVGNLVFFKKVSYQNMFKTVKCPFINYPSCTCINAAYSVQQGPRPLLNFTRTL
uniref:Uncharacterized protein n=1 Tax=Schistocephalus solidus TaxID=70667 RepID=A0A0X3PPC5_SCHSO